MGYNRGCKLMDKKRVLVTGVNGYIAQSFFSRNKDIFDIYFVSLRDNEWEKTDFSIFDSLVHLAAIVHRNETKEEYEKVNVRLTTDVIQKAKHEGVKQFIFMSTMAVYGEEGLLNMDAEIDINTVPHPKTEYGKSKLKTENEILKMVDENFKVAIVRPPMVYGANCPGNFSLLKKLICKIPFFPKVKDNKRSMIHIDNLCQFLKLLILNGSKGMFLPQDERYMSTMDMAKHIASACGKRIFFSSILGLGINFLKGFNISYINKLFGNAYYKQIEYFDNKYVVQKYPENIHSSCK